MIDIQSALAEAVSKLENSDSAELDAALLLSYVLNKPRTHLVAWPEKLLNTSQYQQFQSLLLKRIEGVPVAYILGEKEFWSRSFAVSNAVLIPRPETELLIELVLSELEQRSGVKLLDLGTGSGVLAITLALEMPGSEVWATDKSVEALEIAKINAADLGADQICFIESSWFSEIGSLQFDMIVSNPPYIPESDLAELQKELMYEPEMALTSGLSGLKDIKQILLEAKAFLIPGGVILLEHGFDQSMPVQELMVQNGYHEIKTSYDLSGLPRVTQGRLPC